MEKKFNEKKSVRSYKKPTMRVVSLKHEAHLLAGSGGAAGPNPTNKSGVGLNPMNLGGDL